MNRWQGLGASVIVALAASVSALPQPSSDWKAYFGNLHSHSSVSDGVETPEFAFNFARSEGLLNFICLSEHNHMSSQEGLVSVRQAAEASMSPTFVGLVGQEYSTLPPSGGNHVNVFDVSEPVPAELNNNYREFFREWLPDYASRNPAAIIVCQFNHPANIDRDYGANRIGGHPNYAGNWGEFAADVDPWVSTIAVLSGPADSNMSKSKVPPRDVHRDADQRMLRIWFQYLDRGFHLSPVADQDNHRKSWGTRTTARTGVWINGVFNRESLLTALKEGRCFASEDKNLSVWFSANDKPMGSRLPPPVDAEMSFTVTVADADEPSSRYVVELYRDVVGDGDPPLIIETSNVLANGATWRVSVDHPFTSHELHFVRVNQEDSADDAWSAPIWFDSSVSPEPSEHSPTPGESAEVKFVGSKNRSVYHFPECSVVRQISEANRVNYSAAPAGKRLHQNCPHD